MKRKAKILIMAAIGCLMALSLCAGLYNASAAEGTDPVLITDKASVRIMNAEKKHVDGIRFLVSMSKSDFETLTAAQSVEVHTLMLPEEALAGTELTADIIGQDGKYNGYTVLDVTLYAKSGGSETVNSFAYDDETDRYQAYAYVSDWPFEQEDGESQGEYEQRLKELYRMNIACRSYYTYGQDKTYSVNDNGESTAAVRNMEYLAAQAIADETTLSEEKLLLENYLTDYNVTVGGENYSVRYGVSLNDAGIELTPPTVEGKVFNTWKNGDEFLNLSAPVTKDMTLTPTYIDENVWFNTDNPSVAQGSNTSLTYEWLPELDGVTGVYAVTSHGTGGTDVFFSNRNGFKIVSSKDVYSKYDKLVFRLKASEESVNLQYIGESGPSWNTINVTGGSLGTEWKDFTVDMSTVLADFDNFASTFTFYLSCSKAVTVYIGEIFAYSSGETTWLETDLMGNDLVTWQNDGSQAEPTTFEWLPEVDGEKGVIAITCNDAREVYFNPRSGSWAKPVYSKEYYTDLLRQGYNSIVFRVKATSNIDLRYGHEDTGGFTMKLNGITTTKWTDCEIRLEKILDAYDSIVDKVQCYIHFISAGGGTLYISDISLGNQTDPSVFQSYDEAGWKDYSHIQDWQRLEWLDSFNGETGVMKMEYPKRGENDEGGCGYQIIRTNESPVWPIAPKARMENYNTLRFKLWIECSSSSGFYLAYGSETPWKTKDLVTQATDRGQWIEVDFWYDAEDGGRAVLSDVYTNFENAMFYRGLNNFNDGDVLTVYIASITMVNVVE